MSKANVSEGFRQKVKQFFGVKKGHVIPSSVHDGPKSDEFFFHLELLQEIGKESPLSSRVKVLKELCDFLAVRRVEDHAVEAAWTAVEDLLNPNCPVEARHVTLSFLTVMISGQFDRLGILRAHFFLVVVNHKISEDIDLRLEMLKALSDNGKDISYFEEMIGPFLLSWMPEILQNGRIGVFMPLLINIIHYNSSYLDENVVSGVVRETCHLSRRTKHDEDVELCICLLDAVVRYSCLPSNAVFDFIATACRAVNIEKFCQHSWKIMRNLLGTHLGLSVVYTMCSVMEDSDNGSDVLLLRGSVFFIGMCLWGSQRVPNLKYSNSTVLPSMLQALSCRHSLVALEVTLSVQRLVKKYGHELHVVAWDAVLDITEALQQQIENTPGDTNLIESFHILLTSIEDLYEAGKFNGPEERFFGLVEKSASMRPERSLHILVSFKAQTVHPAHLGWLSNLQNLMEKYFRYEIRTSVRVKVLDVLSSILTSFGHWYEDELLDTAVLPYLNRVSEDQDVTVRNVSVQILLDLAQMCDSSKCQDFLNIIEKVLSRHVELHGKTSPLEEVDQQLLQEEKELKDVKTAVNGLVEVFKAKLFRPPHGHAERTFELLVFHLKAHYCHRYITFIASVIRNLAFECFLSLRCDSHLRLGIVDTSEEESHGKFSPYFLCVHSDSSDIRTGSSSHLGVIPYAEVFDVILNCLQCEWDWTVLEHVLIKLPEVLQNKSLILSANPDLNKMTSVLCHMVSDPSCVIELCRVPRGVGRTGLQALVFPVLTVLATYHSCLDRGRQFELVRALELGLVSRCAVLCVSSLTLCTMEMQAVMKSLLPALLVRLSQISATVSMAAPMLEFLSGLVHLPHLYASFQDSQYKSVFAICLPYTDPFKYSQYTVTLAYHVIASWFIRSRVAYRKGFVGFVSKGLKSSAMLPDHYEPRPESPALAGPRSRSSSSTTQPPPQIVIHRSNSPVNPLLYKETDAACEFHAEMTDVCIDMMARYTFAPCMLQPNRTKAVEFMLASGHRRSWMIGNTIVTITTSGTYIGQDGVCENCWALRARTVDLINDETSEMNATADQKSSVECFPMGGKGERQEKEDSSCTLGLPSDLAGSYHEKHVIAPVEGSWGNVSNKDTKSEPMTTSSAATLDQSTDKSHSNDGTKTVDTRRGSLPEHLFRDASPITVQNCRCVCQGWAEILTRRPSGNISWIMHIQNRPAPVCLDNDVCTAVVDDPQIADFMSPHAEKPAEVLSTSTESGSVLVDVVRQTNPPVGICGDMSNATGLEGASCDWQSGSTEENQLTEPPQPDPVLMYSPTNSSGTPPSTPTWSVDSDTFEGRGRLLSRSPRRGPSVFRMRDPEISERLGSVESTTAEEPTYEIRKHLHFEKPELGMSPAEIPPSPPIGDRSSHPGHGEREKTRYLSSSEMYRLASDEESVQSLNIDEGEDETGTKPVKPVLGERGGKNMEQLEQDAAKHEASHEVLNVSRPKSLELNSLSSGHQVIRESPEFQLESAFPHQDINTVTATSLNERVTKDVEDSRRTAHAKSLDTSSQPSKKVKLKKAASISAPIRTKKGLHHSNSSPFRSPRQVHGSVMLRSREAEDGLGFGGAVRDPKKSTSSPELSSPPPFPKVPPLAKADSTKRLLSRSRHAPASHPANKPTKLGQVTGDPTDTGPKEPPILVTPSESFRYPLDPCFVFLQLYHASFLGPGHDKPQPLPDDEVIERAIKCLDRIPPYDTHKIGVIYVGPGQHDNEAAILRNVYGSSRYMKFLAGLGTLVRLRDCPPAEIYTGGLDRNGADGEFAYSWQDDIYQVIFHVATLMPTRDSDPGCNSKKMHIGNDFVTIVYNDSQQTVKFGRIKGQFNFAEVVIKPLDNESNMVTLRFKDELKDLLTDTGARVISDSNLPRLVRQLAVHINMASVIHQSQKKPTDAYGCNWLERLRQIKRVRSKAAADSFTIPNNPPSKTYPAIVLRPSPVLGAGLTDFTEYVMR